MYGFQTKMEKTGHSWTIQIPDLSRIQMVTILKHSSYKYYWQSFDINKFSTFTWFSWSSLISGNKLDHFGASFFFFNVDKDWSGGSFHQTVVKSFNLWRFFIRHSFSLHLGKSKSGGRSRNLPKKWKENLNLDVMECYASH